MLDSNPRSISVKLVLVARRKQPLGQSDCRSKPNELQNGRMEYHSDFPDLALASVDESQVCLSAISLGASCTMIK